MRAVSLCRGNQPIELTSLQIGSVYVLHLPGEPMIDFQLYAKSEPGHPVAGYGDNTTGYLCPAREFPKEAMNRSSRS